MEDNYSKALAEVFDIINNSQEEIIDKIPNKLYQFLKNNMDKNYKVNIDYNNENWDNVIREDTKEILALIYRDYLVTPEEREQLRKEEAEEEKRIELELRKKYDPDNIFKRYASEDNIKERKSDIQNNTAIVEYKESIFTKIKNWFKQIFSK